MKKKFKFKNSRGTEYKVVFRKPNSAHFGTDCDGYCTNPNSEEPRIYINPHNSDQTILNTVIHEFAHAFFWDKPEKDVKKLADALSRFLYNEKKWRKKSKK